MNLYHAVGTVAEGWVLGLRALRSGAVREPFLLVGTVQLVALITLGFFHAPALVRILEPVVRWIGGPDAAHYPTHFWILPELYRTANALLSTLVAGVAYAVAIGRLSGRQTSWTEAWMRFPALAGIAGLYFGGAWTITSLFNLIPQEITLLSFVIRIGFQAVELGLILVLHSSLLFAPAALILEGRSLEAALDRGVRVAWHHFLPTILLVGVPLALTFPPTFFLYEMNAEEAGVRPEAIGLMMTGLILLRVLFDVTVLGGVARIYSSRHGRGS